MKPPPLAGRLLCPLPASAALRSLPIVVPTPALGCDQNALGSVSAHRWCALSPLASTLTTHLATRRARVEERKCDREGLVHLCALLPRQRRQELHSVGRCLQLGGHGNVRPHRKHPLRGAQQLELTTSMPRRASVVSLMNRCRTRKSLVLSSGTSFAKRGCCDTVTGQSDPSTTAPLSDASHGYRY